MINTSLLILGSLFQSLLTGEGLLIRGLGQGLLGNDLEGQGDLVSAGFGFWGLGSGGLSKLLRGILGV